MTGVTAKVSSLAIASNGDKISETLGYTEANVFNDETARGTIKYFVQSVTALTTNTFSKALVTYEVDLDVFTP